MTTIRLSGWAGDVVQKTKAAKTTAHGSAKKKKARTTSKASKKTVKHKTTGTAKHSARTVHAKHEEHVAHEEHLAHERHIGKAPLLADDVACCSAEALAASARLAGLGVSPGDVLELYFRTAPDPGVGATFWDTLTAAALYGLGGHRPRWFRPLGGMAGRDSNPQPMPLSAIPGRPRREESLLVHVELPAGPHSLCIDPAGRGVWSWGDLYDPAGLGAGPVLEAWAVNWP